MQSKRTTSKTGIFIPLRRTDYKKNVAFVPLSMAEEESALKQKLLNLGIKTEISDAMMTDNENTVYYGLFIRPNNREDQMIFGQIWDNVYPYRYFEDNFYTVPNLCGVISGVGLITKSIHIDSVGFCVHTLHDIIQLFAAHCSLQIRLVMIDHADGTQEIFGTSPLQIGNAYSIWQIFLSKALKKANLPHCNYYFFQSWSTNEDLVKKYAGQGC